MRLILVVAATIALGGCGQAPEASEVALGTKNRSIVAAPALPKVKPGPNTLFVDVERVQRRTCPKITCGDVGWIAERQLVEVLEQRDGWARITKSYDASCKNEVSQYVNAGKSSCTADNGIVAGRFSEWIPISALSKERPVISQSDNNLSSLKTDYSNLSKQTAWINLGKNTIRAKLRDPDSAQWRNVNFHSGGGVPIVCGEVNANNGFGGKSGYERFIAAGDKLDVLESEMRSSSDMDTIWAKFCR